MYQDRSCKTCEYAWKYYSRSAFYKEKENESREKQACLSPVNSCFLMEIIKIYAYVMVFMYIPKLVFQNYDSGNFRFFNGRLLCVFYAGSYLRGRVNYTFGHF